MKRLASLIFILLFPLHTQAEQYSYESLVDAVKKSNYKVRSKAERVYQAHHRIKVAMGRLIPSLHFGAISSGLGANYFDLAASLFGFLFPSNWFRWSESEYFFYAERYAFAALLANQINGVEAIAYRINYLQSLSAMQEGYRKKIHDLYKIIKKEQSKDDYLQFKNKYLQIDQDYIQTKSAYKIAINQLGHALALDPQNWSDVTIQRVVLPRSKDLKTKKEGDMVQATWARSFELQELRYLMRAAKKSRLARKFEFLTPSSSIDSALGFGYPSYLEISNSKVDEVKLHYQEMRSNLALAVKKALSDYNSAVSLYKRTKIGFANSEILYMNQVKKVVEEHVLLTQDFLQIIENLIKFHTEDLALRHRILIAQAQIDRLLLVGEKYDDLLSFSPGKPLGELSKAQLEENRAIRSRAG